MNPDALVEYWHAHYASEHCTLCGNWGIIDTRLATTPAGYPVGRLNYCICPNGLAMRERKAPLKVGEGVNLVRSYNPLLHGDRCGCDICAYGRGEGGPHS